LPCVAVAGDGGGIAGAEAAALSGRLAALDAAMLLGHIGETERDRRAHPIRAAFDRERTPRPFLDRLYRPRHSVLVPADDEVIACRCEEVSVGGIRQAARLGATGRNQFKAFTRCGDGTLSGSDLRPGSGRGHGRHSGQADRRNRHPTPEGTVQAAHPRHPRRSRNRQSRANDA
jgi:hypothetical protein